MRAQHNHGYQPQPSNAEREELRTMDSDSIDLQDLRPVNPDTVSQISNLSSSEVVRSENEELEQHSASVASLATTPLISTIPPWLPYTLRRVPLCLILSFCLLLEFAVIVVHAISSKNFGLAEDDGSTAIVIGSKFVPTLLAVVFGLLATILLDDVKRTEPFARMASSAGATARQSLTWTAGTWWPFPNSLGKGKLPLFSAALVFVLGSLVLSPLSSTLLVAQAVVFDEKTPFRRLDLSSLLPIQPVPRATTYFRTISNILQNVSTTAWITNDYVVLPFWPGNLSTIPLSPILSDEAQTWSAYTTIFSVDLDCKPMEPQWSSSVISSAVGTGDLSVTLAARSGCTINLEFSNSSDFYTLGGDTWSSTNNISFSRFADQFNNFIDNNGSLYEKSNFRIHGCSENEMLLSSTEGSYGAFGSNLTNFFLGGQTCQNTYYVGNSTASVTLGQGQSIVTINATEYHLTKKPIAATIANTAAFDDVFFDSNWTIHLNAYYFSSRHTESAGPANLLSALHQFSPAQILADASITESMQRIRRQFFAELLHGTFELMTVSDAVDIPGSVITTSRRIVVASGVAIALEVVLLALSVLIATVLYTTRPSKRLLGLYEDPAPVASVAKLLSNNPPTIAAFTKSSNGSPSNLDQSLSRFHFTLAQGQIEATEETIPNAHDGMRRAQEMSNGKLPEGGSGNDAKKHRLFTPWLLVLFLVFVSLTLAAIATLYQLSRSQGLYNTIFVYNIDISISGRRLGAISPASLLTTFIGVIISVWWGSFDNTLRKVQPYLALAKSLVSGYRGIAISYKSSYLLWAAYRAARRSHWILLLVSTGAFLTQILTIALSSLWTRAPGTLTELIVAPRTLELRNVPTVGVGILPQSPHGRDASATFIENIFSNLATSWIYGATTQLTLQGPDPPWSIDGWSFVPCALNVTSSQSVQNTGNSSELPMLSVNVTIKTPATRARLECSPYHFLDDETRWITKWDLTNKTDWNTTANPSNLEVGFELGLVGDDDLFHNSFYLGKSPGSGNHTTFFANFRRLQCCENRTAQSVGLASIGYWSANLAPTAAYPKIADTWPANFTIKWIRGRPIEGIRRAGEWPGDTAKHLLFIEPPQMTALNCQPIIESAHSQVTVDAGTGRVISYDILEMPQAYNDAWNSPWVGYQHNFTWDDPRSTHVNITVSHGVLFVTGLLGAADIYNFGGKAVDVSPANNVENVQEQTFNFRQPGLNVDYMTYAMLSLVDFDHQQLLDAATLERTASRTFSTMYQHFVNNNLSLTSGGYAYQPFGEKPADDIGERYEGLLRRDATRDTTASTAGDRDIVMQVSRPVELLNISTPVAWICLVILAYLIVSSGVLAVASRQYNRMLPGLIDTIADTAVLVAGSAKLLRLARLRSVSSIKSDGEVLAGLGWFVDADGQKRWGIELSDGPGDPDRLAHRDGVASGQPTQAE